MECTKEIQRTSLTAFTMGFDSEALASPQEVTNHSVTGNDFAPGTVLLEDFGQLLSRLPDGRPC